jgi:hypothetical protein
VSAGKRQDFYNVDIHGSDKIVFLAHSDTCARVQQLRSSTKKIAPWGAPWPTPRRTTGSWPGSMTRGQTGHSSPTWPCNAQLNFDSDFKKIQRQIAIAWFMAKQIFSLEFA